MSWWHLRRAVQVLKRGGLVLHATEGVWGLACDPFDPAAVAALLAAKQRPAHKGLILMGADADVFEPELAALAPNDRARVRSAWPGAVTWLLPTRRFPAWITGGRDTVAARVPGHPLARALAAAFGGSLVSTSANRSGRPAARNRFQARRQLRTLRGARSNPYADVYMLPGETLGRTGPSEIRTLGGACLRGARGVR